MSIRIVRPEERHRAGWDELYAGYARFYRTEQTAKMRDRVWSWLHDESEALEAFVAEDAEGGLVGLAHFREFHRPLSATRGGFLDDLFVTPAARGSGAGLDVHVGTQFALHRTVFVLSDLARDMQQIA